jgi:hypothetical protein
MKDLLTVSMEDFFCSFPAHAESAETGGETGMIFS